MPLLADFYKEHGHIRICPDDNRDIWLWLKTQRSRLKNKTAWGKGTEEDEKEKGSGDDDAGPTLSKEKVWRLDSLSLEWREGVDEEINSDGETAMDMDTCGRKGPKPLWQERFRELESFRSERGHCNVSLSKDGGLGLWAHLQRTNYWRWRRGEKTTLTAERVKRLEGIEFLWHTRNFPKKKVITVTARNIMKRLPKVTSPSDVVWNVRLLELWEFHKKQGHCYVPASAGELGRWVEKQRDEFARRLKGEPSDMTDERRDLLEGMRFDWYVTSSAINDGVADSEADPDGNKRRERRWQARFEELRRYKELHRHTNVRVKDGKLGGWVKTQRESYKITKGLLKNAKRKTYMTPERERLLEELDFNWRLYGGDKRCGEISGQKKNVEGPKTKAELKAKERKAKAESNAKTAERIKQLVDVQWNNHLEELQRYKEVHGNVNPNLAEGDLGLWVRNQRRSHKRMVEGKSSSMTDERKQKLADLGFQWELPKRSRREERWNERFEELRRYRETHGHIDVPEKSGPLGKWLKNQREQYRLHMASSGNGSGMTDERRLQLEGVDIKWRVQTQPLLSKRYSERDGQNEDDNRSAAVLSVDSSHGEVSPPPASGKWNQNNDIWEERIKALCQFKKENEHLVVPTRYPVLGYWASLQRKANKLREKGEESTLTDERKKQLDDLGHCRISQKQGLLGRWLANQRLQYRKLMLGKKSLMTKKHLEELNYLDKCWNIKPSILSSDVRWYKQYHALREFKKKHGHCR